MKKRISLFLALALIVVCTGCGGAPAPTPAPTEAAAAPVPAAAPAAETRTEAEPTQENKVMVVYFSVTGTTQGVAEKIAALTGGELAEIVPAQPYTAEDLNYNDHTTRATVEQNTTDARPEIANEISLDGCTTVYLGYPIWWGQAPRIVSRFVESHDFTGMTVIPFCTSGSSGAGRTGETLGEQAGTGTFVSSTRLSAGVSDGELQKWIDSVS